MTKDECDEWMRERGFRPLEDLKSPNGRRISPEQAKKVRLWLDKDAEALARVIILILAKRITKERGLAILAETHKRNAEEFGIKLSDPTDE